MANEEVPTYIGKKSCGCVVLAIVDDGKDSKYVAREVAKGIRDGLIIERVTVGWVRTNGLKSCPDHQKPITPKQTAMELP